MFELGFYQSTKFEDDMYEQNLKEELIREGKMPSEEEEAEFLDEALKGAFSK